MGGLCKNMFIGNSSQYQYTALHNASRCGHWDMVNMLLKRGADPNTCDLVSGVWIMYNGYLCYMSTLAALLKI